MAHIRSKIRAARLGAHVYLLLIKCCIYIRINVHGINRLQLCAVAYEEVLVTNKL